MPEERATGDTLVLPFTVGVLIGSALMGLICIVLGLERHLCVGKLAAS